MKPEELRTDIKSRVQHSVSVQTSIHLHRHLHPCI